jgi:hypothetical protein
VDGLVEVKALLKIACSNQNPSFIDTQTWEQINQIIPERTCWKVPHCCRIDIDDRQSYSHGPGWPKYSMVNQYLFISAYKSIDISRLFCKFNMIDNLRSTKSFSLSGPINMLYLQHCRPGP